MPSEIAPNLIERRELRDRAPAFRDRRAAGEFLSDMLADLRGSTARVLAVPAGGVPVGAEMAARLDLPLGVAVVSKIVPRFSTEVGYGAVAFDGTVRLNDALVARLGLSVEEVDRGIAETTAKVERRVASLGGRPPDLEGLDAILVDDGLASGFTMVVALEAVRRLRPARAIVAVPTAHPEAVRRLPADLIYCPNVRTGMRFAVADAYRDWYDVPEAEAREILARRRDKG